jgi:hypothetical protein
MVERIEQAEAQLIAKCSEAARHRRTRSVGASICSIPEPF